jgi:hypothetical protein
LAAVGVVTSLFAFLVMLKLPERPAEFVQLPEAEVLLENVPVYVNDEEQSCELDWLAVIVKLVPLPLPLTEYTGQPSSGFTLPEIVYDETEPLAFNFHSKLKLSVQCPFILQQDAGAAGTEYAATAGTKDARTKSATTETTRVVVRRFMLNHVAPRGRSQLIRILDTDQSCIELRYESRKFHDFAVLLKMKPIVEKVS